MTSLIAVDVPDGSLGWVHRYEVPLSASAYSPFRFLRATDNVKNKDG
jgi:hypothetical protein